MKGWDPTGEQGPKKPLPDMVTIIEPPLDKVIAEPTSEQRGVPEIVPQQQQAPVDEQAYQQDQQYAVGYQPEEPAF